MCIRDSSEGMYRGLVGPDGQIVVLIYRDEERR